MEHNSAIGHAIDSQAMAQVSVAPGERFTIGNGFSANGFKYPRFDGAMNPLLMVDHYVMTAPTFGAHGHAGLSAVTLLFEDSTGQFHNRDSLGNDFDLNPGDLYWLNAGNGVVHDERPRHGARTHGLQMFVNMPDARRHSAPQSNLVRADTVAVVQDNNRRIRVLLGEFEDAVGACIPSQPTTLLDGNLARGSHLRFTSKPFDSVWFYAISGSVSINGQQVVAGQALALSGSAHPSLLTVNAADDSHFVLLACQVIDEPFVQRGPFAMRDEQALVATNLRYRRGEFGTINS